jgi:hypothetical protein
MKLSLLALSTLSVVTSFLLFSPISLEAQSRSGRRQPSQVSLVDMKCQKYSGEYNYQPANIDVPIGRQVFRAIGWIGEISINWGGTPIMVPGISGISCRLAKPNESPRFKTLSLTFGFSDRWDIEERKAEFRIYKDGKLYTTETIEKGDPIRLPVDITNARSLSFEAECEKRPGHYIVCPAIFFLEDILE